MKHFLKYSSSLLIALTTLVGCQVSPPPPTTKTSTAPAIEVSVQGLGGGGLVAIPAVEGYVGKSHLDADTAAGKYLVDGTYRVMSNPDRFFVQAHYDITCNGVTTKLDRTLPVFEKKPDASRVSKLDDHYTAFAYLDGTTVSY